MPLLTVTYLFAGGLFDQGSKLPSLTINGIDYIMYDDSVFPLTRHNMAAPVPCYLTQPGSAARLMINELCYVLCPRLHQ